MRYIGGKHRIAKWIAETCEPYMQPYTRFLEPFCGGLSATVSLVERLNQRGTAYEYYASDAQPALIPLLRAVQEGWIPPDTLTEQEYAQAKALPVTDPLHGFAAFCCSFGGKYWGGYAREGQRNFAQQGRNALLRKIKRLDGVEFVCAPYEEWSWVKDVFVYCDPPYAGVTNGYGLGAWDSKRFWKWVRNLGANGNMVIISEYEAPDDIPWLASLPSKRDLRGVEKPQETVEHLFIYRGKR